MFKNESDIIKYKENYTKIDKEYSSTSTIINIQFDYF